MRTHDPHGTAPWMFSLPVEILALKGQMTQRALATSRISPPDPMGSAGGREAAGPPPRAIRLPHALGVPGRANRMP